jgi:hypothetical protein
VYVNYGTVEDLAELERLNVSVVGKICIARYGKIFRGNKGSILLNYNSAEKISDNFFHLRITNKLHPKKLLKFIYQQRTHPFAVI